MALGARSTEMPADSTPPVTPLPASIRLRLRRVVDDAGTPAGRIFDTFLLLLILLCLATFSLDTLPRLTSQQRQTLEHIETVSALLFTIEYLLRLWVAERPIRFALSFFGIVDLVAILPFLLTDSLDIRSLRAVRFLLLFRAFKLVRYTAALHRFRRAFAMAREELVLFLCSAALVFYFAGVGIYYCEHAAQPNKFASVFDGLWWALCTLTTVGYGDIYPITPGGKFFTIVVLMVGLGVVAVPTGLVASALSRARDEDDEIRREG